MAQRLSLAERVTKLENQANVASQGAGQANLEAQNRMVQLQAEVQSLRNLVEQLQNEISQLKQTQRQQYLDLDGRLARLDGAAPRGSAPLSDDAGPAPTNDPMPPARDDGGFVDAEPVDPDSDPTLPADTGGRYDDAFDDSAPADPAGEEAAYQAALDALVERFEAADAARMFRAFIGDYPRSGLIPNAWYWLGESYYVTQNYELAQDAFVTLLRDHPASRKEADAMLKLGYSQIALGDAAAGERTLRDLATRYPGTEAAAKAESRLRTLTLENG
jgi:tol-pal system protein YbgF